MSKNLFEEILSIDLKKETEEKEAPEQDDIQGECVILLEEEESANTPIIGSPVYPRIFWGDSAKPLMGQFPNSEYVDDNIHRTYEGLLSYLG